jgi:hypothetical protein
VTWNPLWEFWGEKYNGVVRDKYGMRYGSLSQVNLMDIYQARTKAVRQWAFSVPSPDAISAITTHAPRIVELCAGTGYWAKVLALAGCDVIALDKIATGNSNDYMGGQEIGEFFPVRPGDIPDVAAYPDRALMLAWPPYDSPVAREAVESWGGDVLVYIGEPPGGCTADDSFFAMLETDFTELAYVDLPSWDGIHDYLTIQRRNGEVKTRKIEVE